MCMQLKGSQGTIHVHNAVCGALVSQNANKCPIDKMGRSHNILIRKTICCSCGPPLKMGLDQTHKTIMHRLQHLKEGLVMDMDVFCLGPVL